jgi:hypothetical protein
MVRHVHATELAADEQTAQNQLKIAQEEHTENLKQARDDFDARIATLVRLNDANASIAQHKFETDLEAATQEQTDQRLAAVAKQNEERLAEVEQVCLEPI